MFKLLSGLTMVETAHGQTTIGLRNESLIANTLVMLMLSLIPHAISQQ